MPSPKVASARTIANRAAKIVYNKAAVDALYAGMVDGLLEIGETIRADYQATAPRDPEIAAKRGVPMMADSAHVAVWGLGKLVSGDTTVAAGANKPRGIKTPADQVVMTVYVSSPIAHFSELGTIKEVAHPALLPAFNRGVPGAEKVLVPAMGKRIRAVP